MKATFISNILTFTFFFSTSIVYAQDSVSTNTHEIIGRWNICIGDSVSSDFKCPDKWIWANFEFAQNGQLIDSERDFITKPGEEIINKYEGRYEYQQNILTIKIPKGDNGSLNFEGFKIIWFNENLFYSIQKGDINGTVVYYFERTK